MREFKFFHGRTPHKLTALWNPELINDVRYGFDVSDEVINTLSEELSREIDELLIRDMTRRINGGNNNNNIDYLNHYINMGGGNRA